MFYLSCREPGGITRSVGWNLLRIGSDSPTDILNLSESGPGSSNKDVVGHVPSVFPRPSSGTRLLVNH